MQAANTFLRPPAGSDDPRPIAKGEPAPTFSGTTLDGEAFDLASLRGRPVIVNFWGPSCVPCRDEFPLLRAKLDEHAGAGLAIVGVLMFDPPAPARDFIRAYGATWPTVDDPTARSAPPTAPSRDRRRTSSMRPGSCAPSRSAS